MLVRQAEEMGQYGYQAPPPPNVDEIVVKRVFGVMSFLLIFIIPILTMRVYSEEYRSGTIELLWTSPVKAEGVLAGKFLASLVLYAGIIGLSLFYIGVAALYTEPGAGPDIGLVFTSSLGMLMLGGTFIAVGIFSSALTENQIVAAVISFSILLFFLVISAAAQYVGSYSASEFLRYLSLSGHMNGFLSGVLSLRDIVYYLTFIAFMVFLTNRVIESRRWRT